MIQKIYMDYKEISEKTEKYELMTKNSKIFIDDLLDKIKITNQIKLFLINIMIFTQDINKLYNNYINYFIIK